MSATATPTKNHAWIYFFAFLIVASVGVTAFMIWFNLSIQLTAKQLNEAKDLWKENGPKDYNLIYTKRLNDDSRVHTFKIKVRAGKVEEVLLDGKPLAQNKDEGQEQDPRIFHSMHQILRDIERFMDQDSKPGAPKVYVTAIFDDKNGALRRYIRRVMGTNLRIEMHLTVEAVEK